MIYDKSLRDTFSDALEASGEVIFSPFKFKNNDLDPSLVHQEAPLDKLIYYGKVASAVKSRFERAIIDASDDKNPELRSSQLDSAAKNINLQRAYDRKINLEDQLGPVTLKAKYADNSLRKPIHRSKLSSTELRALVEAARCERLTHKELAFKYGVSQRLIQSLMS